MGYCNGIPETKTTKKAREDGLEILKNQQVQFDKLEIKMR
jgi:hypothetical protein